MQPCRLRLRWKLGKRARFALPAPDIQYEQFDEA